MKSEMLRSVAVTETLNDCEAKGFKLDHEWRALAQQYVTGAISLPVMVEALRESCRRSGNPGSDECQTRLAASWLVASTVQRILADLRVAPDADHGLQPTERRASARE